jgi:hypothetical protein
MTYISGGLSNLPLDHISHSVNKILHSLELPIIPMALQDIPLSRKEFNILSLYIINNHLEIEVGYYYYGGTGSAMKAYSDLNSTNTDKPEVHIYLVRKTPRGWDIKGLYIKDLLRIPLNAPCFSAPVNIHIHHTEYCDHVLNGNLTTKEVVIKKSLM